MHCHDGIQLYKRVLGMLLEPFYTERNWTTKNQVLAYQRKFVNADTHREILLSQNFILCKCCKLLILYFFENLMGRYICICHCVIQFRVEYIEYSMYYRFYCRPVVCYFF